MTVVELEDAEVVWNLWLSGLTPWEIHWLTPRELDLHDKFIAGDVSLLDIRSLIATDHGTSQVEVPS